MPIKVWHLRRAKVISLTINLLRLVVMQAHLVSHKWGNLASVAFFAGLVAIVVILYKTKESKKSNNYRVFKI